MGSRYHHWFPSFVLSSTHVSLKIFTSVIYHDVFSIRTTAERFNDLIIILNINVSVT